LVETILGKALLYRVFLSWEGAGKRAAEGWPENITGR